MPLARPRPSRVLPLLTLLWLLPGIGHAAPQLSDVLTSDVPRASTLQYRWHSSYHPHYSHYGHGHHGPLTRAGRIFTEVGLGLSGGLLGGVLGYIFLAPKLPCEEPARLCTNVVLSTTALMGLGMAGAVYGMGQLLEGHGDFFLGSFLGMATGFAAGAVLALPFQKTVGPGVGFLTLPPFMLLGAVVGYELTAQDPVVNVQPVVSLSPGGGARVGLMGRF